VCGSDFSLGQGGRITSVDRATREEGTLSLDAFLLLELQSISVRSCYCIRFHCISLLIVFTT
jgi:hypothetical protein